MVEQLVAFYGHGGNHAAEIMNDMIAKGWFVKIIANASEGDYLVLYEKPKEVDVKSISILDVENKKFT